jgi:anthranilate synthase component 2
MILLIDNYDSFTYNLYQLIGTMKPNMRVVRNDAISVQAIAAMDVSQIILSPGPGRPADAGICEEVIRRYAGVIPILGVCLGHQAICEVYGGVVGYAKTLMHGKASCVTLDTDCPLFAHLPAQIEAGRYHSLTVARATLPAELQLTAYAEDGEVMAVQHRAYAVYGVQFHPESILSPAGKQILTNFLQIRQATTAIITH